MPQNNSKCSSQGCATFRVRSSTSSLGLWPFILRPWLILLVCQDTSLGNLKFTLCKASCLGAQGHAYNCEWPQSSEQAEIETVRLEKVEKVALQWPARAAALHESSLFSWSEITEWTLTSEVPVSDFCSRCSLPRWRPSRSYFLTCVILSPADHSPSIACHGQKCS